MSIVEPTLSLEKVLPEIKTEEKKKEEAKAPIVTPVDSNLNGQKLFKFQASEFKNHREVVESLLKGVDASIDLYSQVIGVDSLNKTIESEVLAVYELLFESVKIFIGPNHFSTLLSRFGAVSQNGGKPSEVVTKAEALVIEEFKKLDAAVQPSLKDIGKHFNQAKQHNNRASELLKQLEYLEVKFDQLHSLIDWADPKYKESAISQQTKHIKEQIIKQTKLAEKLLEDFQAQKSTVIKALSEIDSKLQVIPDKLKIVIEIEGKAPIAEKPVISEEAISDFISILEGAPVAKPDAEVKTALPEAAAQTKPSQVVTVLQEVFSKESVSKFLELVRLKEGISAELITIIDIRLATETPILVVIPEWLKDDATVTAQIVETEEFIAFGQVTKSQPAVLHGKGIQIMKKSDSILEGWFKLSYLTGVGTQLMAGGKIYEGEFKNSIRSGTGLFKWPSSAYYKGDWAGGKMHGEGKYHSSTGVEYTGQWRQDKKHGKGLLTLGDESYLSGSWVDDKKHGEFEIKDKQKKLFKVTFEHDVKGTVKPYDVMEEVD